MATNLTAEKPEVAKKLPQDRTSRRAVRISELDEEWVIALAKTDYSHLPSREDTPPKR